MNGIDLGLVLPAIKLTRPVIDYRIYGDAVIAEWEPIPPANMRTMQMEGVLTDRIERIDPARIGDFGPIPEEHLFQDGSFVEPVVGEEVETPLPEGSAFETSQSM